MPASKGLVFTLGPNMTTETNPRLEPPGAGLGAVEGWVVRRLSFPFFRRSHSFDSATRVFEREGARIEDLCGLFTPEQFTRRVLVPPMAGIEDSSRFWSAAMLIEHVVIVGESISKVLVFLSHGQVPPFTVDIAAIKPRGLRGAAVMADFRRLLAEYPGLVRTDLPRPSDAPHFAHPWLGELDIHGWHCLAAVHLRLHRRQLQRIRQALLDEPPRSRTPAVFSRAVPDSPPSPTG